MWKTDGLRYLIQVEKEISRFFFTRKDQATQKCLHRQ